MGSVNVQTQSSPQTVQQPKILRIGVIQAGHIIEEKLVRRPENVTIGSSTRNTITIFTAGLPRAFTLFERIGNRYLLNFSEAMDGRVSAGDRILPLLQVAEENLARRRGDVWQLPLDESSRGKMVLGEVTLLFQFVTPPPPRPRPQLPPSVRGGLIAQMDWLMASCFMACAVSHLALVIYLRNVDWPKEIAIDQIPDRFVKDIVVERPKPVEKKVDAPQKGPGEEKKEKKAGSDGDAKKSGKKQEVSAEEQAVRAEAAARAAAERRARLAEELSRVGALKVLGSTGGKTGAVADLLNRGDPGGDADRAFQGVGGVGVASASGSAGGLAGRGGAGAGRAIGIEGLRTTGPGAVETGGRAEEKEVKGHVREETPDVDGSLDPNIVAKEVRKRLGAVRTCYERALKRNPQLAGKISVCFTIGATGAVSEARVDADTMGDSEVGDCIVDNVKRWRFPAPDGGSVEVCYPFVFTAAQ